MTRVLPYILAFCLCLAPLCAAGRGFETYHARVDATPERIVRSLADQLPDTLAVSPAGQGFIVTYSGPALPAPIIALVDKQIPIDDVSTAAPFKVSLAVYPSHDGSALRLMIYNPGGAGPDVDLPRKARVLLSEGRSGGCSAQLVLEHAEPLAQSEETWTAWLHKRGFAVTPVRDETGTLIVGQRADCAVVVNVETDTDAPDHTLVVVRFSEE